MSTAKPTIVQRLIGYLPDKVKRILFGVLVFQSCLGHEATSEQLEALNSDLDLAFDASGLQLPALWWRSFNVFDNEKRKALLDLLATDTVLANDAVAIVSSLPQWLSYAQPEQIANDLVRIVKHARMVA